MWCTHLGFILRLLVLILLLRLRLDSLGALLRRGGGLVVRVLFLQVELIHAAVGVGSAHSLLLARGRTLARSRGLPGSALGRSGGAVTVIVSGRVQSRDVALLAKLLNVLARDR